MALDPITAGLDFGKMLISRWFPDKEEQSKREADLYAMAVNGDLAILQKRMDVIIAEAQSQSWLTQSWRPITMLSFVAIIINNYILVPYARAMGWESITLVDIPTDLWELIKIGLGGYVVGRTVEQTVKTIANKSVGSN